jgi:hypothetical protein
LAAGTVCILQEASRDQESPESRKMNREYDTENEEGMVTKTKVSREDNYLSKTLSS